MSNRIDLTQFEELMESIVICEEEYIKGQDSLLEDCQTLKDRMQIILAELKICYERLDMANEALLTAREVLMKHHEWMSMNDATSEEDDQEILDVVKALREASE